MTYRFGVVGHSGMGKDYGKAGFDGLNNAKSTLISPADRHVDVFPPYGEKNVAKLLGVFSRCIGRCRSEWRSLPFLEAETVTPSGCNANQSGGYTICRTQSKSASISASAL